jgi:hypothetical protein
MDGQKVEAILRGIKLSGMGCAKRVRILFFNGLWIVLVDMLNFSTFV